MVMTIEEQEEMVRRSNQSERDHWEQTKKIQADALANWANMDLSERLNAALRVVEWEGEFGCPLCNRWPPWSLTNDPKEVGHEADCLIGMALSKREEK